VPRRYLLPLLVLAFCLVGCDVEQTLDRLANPAPPQTVTTDPPPPAPAPTADGDTIKVASFNIQVFGTSKLGKPHVMDILAQVVRRFDVVAIQEIRSKDTTVLPRFVELINADGRQYDYVIGPRQGRTTSKEQYAFIFDATRIEYDRDSIRVVDDPDDLLHREPMVTSFRVRGLPPSEAFTFTLVNIHTDPDETDTELDALADVFMSVQKSGSEDDVILLGDRNVDEYDLGKLGRLPGITWAISGQMTNTRRTKAYDNVVFNRQGTAEYTGTCGVFDLMAEFGLSVDEALDVSDHLPVWAEFSVRESTVVGPVAARPARGE